MAERRCLSKKILESDAFYDLPPVAQAIYAHLCINADDDGFVNCADSVMQRFRNGRANVELLLSKRFLLRYKDIVVVKHWRIMNSLKNDRIKPLQYPEIAKLIWVKENRSYTDHFSPGCKTLFEIKTGIQTESSRNPNGILKEKNRKEQNRKEQNRTADCGEWFYILWSFYPENRRGDMAKARESFDQVIHSEDDFQIARECLTAWVMSKQWQKDNGQYIPYMVNWFDRGSWMIKPEPNKPSDGRRELDEDEIAAIHRMMNEDFEQGG